MGRQGKREGRKGEKREGECQICFRTALSQTLLFPSLPPPSLSQPLLQVIYVTATLPLVVLLCLFFRAVTLPGAERGLKCMFVPNEDTVVRVTRCSGRWVGLRVDDTVEDGRGTCE